MSQINVMASSVLEIVIYAISGNIKMKKEITKMNKVIDAGALIDALEHEDGRTLGLKKVKEVIDNQPSADVEERKRGEWIACSEAPDTDRNVFIARGTPQMKSCCIGHYEQDMGLWYEDRDFFASPIYDAMYWREIPPLPTEQI